MTGGTGFLGSHLLKTLIESGKTVHCLRRESSSDERIDRSVRNQVQWVNIENCNFDQYFKKNGISYVLHCATNYGRAQNDPNEIVESNLILPLKLLHAASQNQVKAFLNTDTILDKGIGSYSLSKKQFSEWLQSYSDRIVGINIALEHFYGPYDDPSKFVTYILRELLTDVDKIDLTEGRQKRDFIHIHDVVSAFQLLIKSIDKLENGFYHYEVGTGQSIEISKFVELSKRLVGNSNTTFNLGAIPYRKNEVMDTKANISKLLALGWKPHYTLEDGLIDTIKKERLQKNTKGVL